MKNENLATLIRELLNLNELHEEYSDNNLHYAIDSQKNGDTLIIKVTLKENKDKKEFEEYVNKMPEDLFQETWEALSEEDNLHSLDEIYNSKDYKKVICRFKQKATEIARNKINSLKAFAISTK